jgi:hypothetical protein
MEAFCWPCRHDDHENCTGKCFCPQCWDYDEPGCDYADPGHEAAVKARESDAA